MICLRKAVENYLVIRRSLGFKLLDMGYNLHHFVSFCRAGFYLAMSMHFSSKNKKTSTFLKKWVKAMASADDRKLKSN